MQKIWIKEVGGFAQLINLAGCLDGNIVNGLGVGPFLKKIVLMMEDPDFSDCEFYTILVRPRGESGYRAVALYKKFFSLIGEERYSFKFSSVALRRAESLSLSDVVFRALCDSRALKRALNASLGEVPRTYKDDVLGVRFLNIIYPELGLVFLGCWDKAFVCYFLDCDAGSVVRRAALMSQLDATCD